MAGAFDRREVARLFAGKGTQAHRIALAQRDVAEQQAGIERVIEVRQLIILAAHVPAAVEHENDLLISFVLVLPGNRRALAGGGFPVDLAQAVAFAKFAQLMEFQAQAASLSLAYAELAEPVVHRQQLAAVEAGEVGVDAGRVGHARAGVCRTTGPRGWAG